VHEHGKGENHTVFCGKCGTSNPDDNTFCVRCGRSLAPAVPLAAGPSRGAPGGSLDGLDGQPTIHWLATGTRLINRYRIVRRLGRGGMGEAYLAEDDTLRLQVAIKTVAGLLADDAGAVERLKEEAKLAMQLAHPHIVRVNHFEDGASLKFLVMEYVEGETLAQRLAREKRLREDDVRSVGTALCEALAHAHGRQVLHRDVKMANVLLGKDGSIKLADFGIARVARDSVSRLTGGVTSGTLLYMAPEQVMGDPATVRSDLYSLGAVLYELLSGQPPFHTGAIERQILEKPPQPLAEVSDELNALVLGLLSKRSEEGAASAQAVRDELDGTAPRRRADAAREREAAEAEAQRREEQRRRHQLEEQQRREAEERRRAEEAASRASAAEAQRQAAEAQARRLAEEKREAGRRQDLECAQAGRQRVGS
jgi:serine/threonine-protein kinase